MRYVVLLLLVISCAAIAQEYDPNPIYETAIPDDSASFYILENVTPGDLAKMSASQRAALQKKYSCDYPHSLIDEQIALENAGHVGFYDWRNLRALEKQDCPQEYPYRAGVSTNDPETAPQPSSSPITPYAVLLKKCGPPPPNYGKSGSDIDTDNEYFACMHPQQ